MQKAHAEEAELCYFLSEDKTGGCCFPPPGSFIIHVSVCIINENRCAFLKETLNYCLLDLSMPDLSFFSIPLVLSEGGGGGAVG